MIEPEKRIPKTVQELEQNEKVIQKIDEFLIVARSVMGFTVEHGGWKSIDNQLETDFGQRAIALASYFAIGEDALQIVRVTLDEETGRSTTTVKWHTNRLKKKVKSLRSV